MSQFTTADQEQIQIHGLNSAEIEKQLQQFQQGFPYINITRPADISDGIQKLSDEDINWYINIYDSEASNYNIMKFVPASGAATRMFKDLYEYLSTGTMNQTTQTVLDNISQFAFYRVLEQVLSPNPSPTEIISKLITEAGLNYGKKPKALIPFHNYNDQFILTALEEHLTEGAQYAKSKDKVKIHFTVSAEHKKDFERLLSATLPRYEKVFDVKYEISLSEQKQSTDTIAVNPDNTPFRDSDGRLVFRPSGHGALIENLNNQDADLIFIKNIDNVCLAQHRTNTIKYKKALAGMLIRLQQKIKEFLTMLDEGVQCLPDIRSFIKNELYQENISDSQDPEYYRNILNRPMRICGMIRNIGAPGGGPFWTLDANGQESLQIVESSQIAPDARTIMEKASFFNPVDLVCWTTDYQGNKFDLKEYIDSNTGFISEKSSFGKPLKAMERPGLWNGAMSKWNTIFVEVPQDTFSPVKTVSDLLSAGHKEKM